MTLVELLNRANKGYPDEFLAMYYDTDTGERISASGDGLAEFIVRELSETFDHDLDDDTQIQTATHVLQNAIRDLQTVIDAIEVEHP